jgi:hypothetical protein
VKGDYREALLYGIPAGLALKRQPSILVAHLSSIKLTGPGRIAGSSDH